MLKHQLTNRKFYNKWLYKVSLDMDGVSIYRMKSIQGTVDYLTGVKDHRGIISSTLSRAVHNKDELLKLSNFLLNLKGEYFQRIERNQIDFYTNDPDLHSSIVKNFTNHVRLSFIPRDILLDELDTNKYIICKKLPHKKYRYKAYLLPHKIKDRDDKLRCLNWLVKNDKVYISDATVTWFYQTEWYWDRRYIYIEDEQSLMLVQMRCANALGRIYEYLVSDK